MRHSFAGPLFAALILSVSVPAFGNVEWKKVDEDEGVTIFEQEDPSGFLAFRTEGVVDAPLHAVAGALLDSEHTPDWVDHLEEDKILSRPTPSRFIEYTHVGTPFVLKDRDFLCEVNLALNEKDKTLTIESHSIEDPNFPPTKFVRGSVVHNEFRLSPLAAAKKTKLVGEFHIDPRGSVPKWVVNLFQRAWPKKAFRAIQKRVEEGKSALPVALEPVIAPSARF
ncbi:MAG: START domain-containing protein [Bdellovibrionota bacterium]